MIEIREGIVSFALCIHLIRMNSKKRCSCACCGTCAGPRCRRSLNNKYNSGHKSPPHRNFPEIREVSKGFIYISNTSDVLIRSISLSSPIVISSQLSHMVLSVYQRYEIVFLSNHSLGPQLSHAAVAKEIGCSKSTVKYWLQRWKQSKDLTDTSRSGRRRMTTPKQDQRILSLAEEQTFATAQDVAHQMKRKRVEISELIVRRRLKEVGAKYNGPIAKPLLTECHRENCLKWAQEHQAMNWDQVIYSDETTVHLNFVKGLVWNLPGKKKVVRTVKHPIKVNVWGCFSSRGFGRVVCFRQNLDSKFLYDIYKLGLLPTARKQFGPDSTFWKLPEDNDPKHTSKLATR